MPETDRSQPGGVQRVDGGGEVDEVEEERRSQPRLHHIRDERADLAHRLAAEGDGEEHTEN